MRVCPAAAGREAATKDPQTDGARGPGGVLWTLKPFSTLGTIDGKIPALSDPLK